VRELLARKHLGDHPGVLLSVSEACANAIVHAYPDAGDGRDVDLEARIDGSVLHVRVRDYGVGVETHVRRHGTGYGLMLIEAHVIALDVRECEPGTEVTMTFDLSPR
jgi:anti-sigma regulatory factor (Ser/Thr protein kinase)